MDGVTPAEAAAPAPWNGTIPRTRFFDALSLLLPAGESFVIEALETCGTEAVGCDPAAESVLACFVREERAHQRAHRLYNRALIAATPAAAAPAQRADEAVAQLQGLPLIHRVALAAAFEQL
ncbi:MAG: metal-dependent hydrolase, partial [Vitreoscilla sp.]